MNYLFIYGTLLFNNYKWVKDNNIDFKVIGNGFVNASKIEGTEYPAIVPHPSKIVEGTIIEIDSKFLPILDEYEEYYPSDIDKSLYIRKMVPVAVQWNNSVGPNKNSRLLKCWIYWFNI